MYNCADAVFTVLAVKCAVMEVGEQLEKQFKAPGSELTNFVINSII